MWCFLASKLTTLAAAGGGGVLTIALVTIYKQLVKLFKFGKLLLTLYINLWSLTGSTWSEEYVLPTAAAWTSPERNEIR